MLSKKQDRNVAINEQAETQEPAQLYITANFSSVT
jgi:hypothetical protein